jgi:hypothetical protein
MYVELAEEILHARPVTEEEAKAALERSGVRNGKALAAWIEKRRRCRRTLRSGGSGSERNVSGPGAHPTQDARRQRR